MSQWFYLAQQSRDVPAQCDWLGPAEREVLAGLRFAKRRGDWLLGRWTAKLALERCCGSGNGALSRWEILPDANRVPRVFRDGWPCAQRISISHSNGNAFCAIAPGGNAIGCDIEQLAPRDSGFVDTFFTAAERRAVNAVPGDTERSALTTLIWSAKESTLKAILKGLSVDTRSVEVEPPPTPLALHGWRPLYARQPEEGGDFHGWWRRDERFVWTLVGEYSESEPVSLKQSGTSVRTEQLSGWQ